MRYARKKLLMKVALILTLPVLIALILVMIPSMF